MRTHQGTGKDFKPAFKGRENTKRMNYYSWDFIFLQTSKPNSCPVLKPAQGSSLPKTLTRGKKVIRTILPWKQKQRLGPWVVSFTADNSWEREREREREVQGRSHGRAGLFSHRIPDPTLRNTCIASQALWKAQRRTREELASLISQTAAASVSADRIKERGEEENEGRDQGEYKWVMKAKVSLRNTHIPNLVLFLHVIDTRWISGVSSLSSRVLENESTLNNKLKKWLYSCRGVHLRWCYLHIETSKSI